MKLTDNVQYVPKIGVKRAGILFAELKIKTVEDLLMHFPYRYIDVRTFYPISSLSDNMPYVQIKGQIVSFETKGKGRGKRLVAEFTDGKGFMELVWFSNEKYVTQTYKPDEEYIVFGKPKRYGAIFSMAHPEIEVFKGNNPRADIGFKTMYNTTETMKNHYLNSSVVRELIANLLTTVQLNIPETLPQYLIDKYKLLSRAEAIYNIHLPHNQTLLDAAIRRLKFEELFYIQMSILRQSVERQEKSEGFVMKHIGKHFNDFYKHHLPFSLTNAQKRVVKEIYTDLKSGKQMNRLLQGDVGSGKTIVALLSCLMAVDNGFQACIMAPTEILATQHYNGISKLTQNLGININLLIGSTKKKERIQIHDQLENGQLNILIGTHALIEDNVQFHNLGIVIIDEQHRFGVAQRAKLWTKNIQPPHILVMTATPIPRTLAMTLYGNLDISVIDELPPGRKPIQTYHYYDNKRKELYKFIRRQIEQQSQIYVVYPLIQDSEKLDLKSLEDGYNTMCEVFPDLTIDFLHGKMTPAEKDDRMARFKNGQTDILMSTTVIEVGVDVPNASVMIIESAERFGLSQLHQLRGRVGRGADQSYCILMSSFKLSDNSLRRLQIMTETNNGFDIAEADLTLRGPGELEGTAQSGLPFDLHIANLAQDGIILQTARDISKQILERDPHLENSHNTIIAQRLTELNRKEVNWSKIS
ncbi:ATP-dependent DNA helicase RecG [Porphyromonadaceae bacterium COT-184 OH4590]|nr:ATP-dependent DNA helicase RecG [Porphyromonadaceae bacterium COT-184 OH4590]